jgi:hypothetical protein
MDSLLLHFLLDTHAKKSYLQDWISKNIIAKDKNDKKQRLDKVRDRTG